MFSSSSLGGDNDGNREQSRIKYEASSSSNSNYERHQNAVDGNSSDSSIYQANHFNPYGNMQQQNQQYDYATVMGQSGMPLSIPYGLLQYAQFQEESRLAKAKGLRRGKWTVRMMSSILLILFLL